MDHSIALKVTIASGTGSRHIAIIMVNYDDDHECAAFCKNIQTAFHIESSFFQKNNYRPVYFLEVEPDMTTVNVEMVAENSIRMLAARSEIGLMFSSIKHSSENSGRCAFSGVQFCKVQRGFRFRTHWSEYGSVFRCLTTDRCDSSVMFYRDHIQAAIGVTVEPFTVCRPDAYWGFDWTYELFENQEPLLPDEGMDSVPMSRVRRGY